MQRPVDPARCGIKGVNPRFASGNIVILVLHMSPSGDEEFRWQCSTVALRSPWGSTNEVVLNLAAPWAVQMEYSRSPAGNALLLHSAALGVVQGELGWQ